jgi:glycerol-3-phosphate cytidylyltransferase
MSEIVYTGGTFDLFHSGHVNFLKRCAALGDVYVSLNTDSFVEKYKGSKPVIPYEDRAAVLLACKYVKDVIPNVGNEDSTKAIEVVKPSIIAIGSDWATRDYYSQMGFDQKWLDDRGIGLVYFPYTQTISSTSIKKSIKFV